MSTSKQTTNAMVTVSPANLWLHRVLFVLFFLSGFSGLLYQIVWTRLAFAAFGVNTPVLSVVISAFMLGLALGSWIGGRAIETLTAKSWCSAATFYALLEIGIGLGAFLVPQCFALGDHWLLRAGEMNSATYLFCSALVITLSLLPWCVCMGATFPFMMAYLRERDPAASPSGFSFLYLANVIGAMTGTLLTAVALIELLGFRKTLVVGALANFAVAGVALWLGGRSVSKTKVVLVQQPTKVAPEPRQSTSWLGTLLFATGFVSMAMEVAWIRAFTPYLKTQVYSFAMVLFVYLLATSLGSALYRFHLRRNRCWSTGTIAAYLVAAALLPVALNDPRWLGEPISPVIVLIPALKVLASLFPFCFLLGYLSPRLVDDYAHGDPQLAGRAYALNVLGCIVGPLAAAYLLLPFMGVRIGLLVLAAPLAIVFGRYFFSISLWHRGIAGLLAAGLLVVSLTVSESFEEFAKRLVPSTQVRRDHVATTVSVGRGMERRLIVNGIDVASLTPVTKCMAHLPLAFHKGKPESALIICFGMGTAYRSAMSWDIQTTAVELVPGVKEAFGYYHDDAAVWANHPKGRIIVDDGRRYLKRTAEKFDVISFDNPSSLVQVAGSSLLYSKDFHELAKQHLKPGGILHAWFYIDEKASPTQSAVARSISESFPYVVALPSVMRWGIHFLASMEPFDDVTAEQLLARMPEAARRDLVEWNPGVNIQGVFRTLLAHRKSVEDMCAIYPDVRITDDRPFNEYYLLRTWGIFPPRRASESAAPP